MDPFAVIILGGVAALVVALYVLGRFFPGSGADQLDWRPARTYDQKVLAEIEDLDQMLEATNVRRRRRGDPELTEHALHQRVREDMTEAQKRREAHLAEEDLQQLLDAKNERRRRRGLAPVTLDEVRAEVERWRGSSS
ncbi:MAG: hypothetical protein JWN32_2802 [Solirubrobacterales bacterium]|nr:hypothetical protein [Solirubrobacterales bacterium]